MSEVSFDSFLDSDGKAWGKIPAGKVKRSRPKKKPKRNYRDQADLLFSSAIRGIGYCEECGSSEFLQCAHIVPRGYSRVRVDFRNAVSLCRGCHMFFTPRPLEWDEWVLARIGEDLYLELKRLAREGPEIDWKAEVERLRTDVPDLRSEPLEYFRRRVI